MNAENIVQAVEMGAGFLLTSWAAETFILPGVEHVSPIVQDHHTTFKLVDTLSTGVTAAGLGAVVGSLTDARIGRNLAMGGYVAAATKALGIPIPGIEVQVKIPDPRSLFRANGVTTSGAAQVKAAAAVPQLSAPMTGAGSADKIFTSYPSPVAPNQNVGF